MAELAAVKVAIDLLHVPSQIRQSSAKPLPTGVLTLLRIAAGDPAIEAAASQATGRQPEVVREAAYFFIDQILLHPDSNSYRVLGLPADATAEELRRNMSLLLKRLHPDKTTTQHRSALATRVTNAWNDLKSIERRAAYDLRFAAVGTKPPKTAAGKGRHGPETVASSERARRTDGGHVPSRRERRQPRRQAERQSALRRLLSQLFGRAER